MLTNLQRRKLAKNPIGKGVSISSSISFIRRVLPMKDSIQKDNVQLITEEIVGQVKESIKEFLSAREKRKEIWRSAILTESDRVDTALEKVGDGILERWYFQTLHYLDFQTSSYEEAESFMNSIEKEDVDYFVKAFYQDLMSEYKSDKSPRRRDRQAVRTRDRATEYLSLNPKIFEDFEYALSVNHKEQIFDRLEVRLADDSQKIVLNATDRTIIQALYTLYQEERISNGGDFTPQDVFRAIACQSKAKLSDREIVRKIGDLNAIHESIKKIRNIDISLTIYDNKGTSDRRKTGRFTGRLVPINAYGEDLITGETKYFIDGKIALLQYAMTCEQISYIPYRRISIETSFKSLSLDNFVIRDSLVHFIDKMNNYHKGKGKPNRTISFDDILRDLDRVTASASFKAKLKKKIRFILEDFVVADFIADYSDIFDTKDKRKTIGWKIKLSPDSVKYLSPDIYQALEVRNPEEYENQIIKETKSLKLEWDQDIFRHFQQTKIV